MRRGTQLVASALLLVLLVLSCAPKSTLAPAPQAPSRISAVAPPSAPAPASPAKAVWEMEWGKTVEAAKKEGGLVLYTGMGSVARAALYQGFLQAYGIKMESVAAASAQIMEKIITERRVGLRYADVVLVPAITTLPALKPKGLLAELKPMLLLPEVLDPKAWRTGELRWLDRDHMMVAGLTFVNPVVFINTTQVQAEELQSYRDLLNPKWQGKIISDDPTNLLGPGAVTFSVLGGRIMGWDFVQELVTKQQPVLTRDQRQNVEWVARGKYPIGMAPQSVMISEFQQIGAPIKLIIPKEGAHATSGFGAVTVLTQALHPNATKVFVNWFLSKEGQTIAVKGFGVPSARLDVSAEGIDPVKILQPGAKYIFVDEEKFIIESEAYKEKAKVIFQELKR